jgi:iron complex transport system substrate-binding protein
MRAVLIALALLAVGCGGDEPTADQARPGDGFPVTVQHKFGETVVPAAPERVVAVGFNDQDFALALGVTPVGVRQFQAGIDITGRPWAQDELGGARPEIVGAEELEFEKIAALRPDLILGVYSGLDDRDYATLSKIAPTIAQSDEYPDYGMPWQEQAQVTADALGRDERGTEVVDQVEDELAQVRREHPEFEGSSYVLGSVSGGKVYVYGSQDLRSRFFASLGFRTPRAIDDLAGKSFFAELSEEQLRLLDQDLLVVYGARTDLESLPLAGRLDAVREGRVVFLDADGDLANALGFSSPLSLPYVLEEGVPMLAAAVDGDPSTAVR